MTRQLKRSSPLAGWMEAGADLVAERLVKVAEQVNQKINTSHQLLDDLQHRGEKIDARLKASLHPSSIFNSLQDLLMSNPLRALLPGFKKVVSKREQKLALLSAKVDLLVEQVALLAAKQAAEKQRQAKVVSATPRKTTTKAATSDTAEAQASATKATTTTAKKTTTRRASSTRKTTSSRKPVAANRATKTSTKSDSGQS